MHITPQSDDSEKKARRVPLVIEGATPALGHASQAIKFGDIVYISGQLPVDPTTNKIKGKDIASQTKVCLQSLDTIMDFLGGALSNIMKITIYVVNMEDLPGMEKVYKQYFSFQPPARTIVGASRLPMNARIQMDAVIHPPRKESSGRAF